MQIIQDLTVAGFQSWDRESDYRTKLTVIRSPEAVTLAFSHPYRDAATVSLALTEAYTLSSDICELYSDSGRLVRGGACKRTKACRPDEESKLVLEVGTTTQGEPYEEGVLIEIRRFDHTDFASIELNADVAFALAKVLAAKP